MICAVVDIGSNSIKLLVARGGNAEPLFEAFRETRLSPNAESPRERIPEAAFAAGVRAVEELAEAARAFAPERFAVVGTSLFRTAENAREFADAVLRATGTPMRVLSGVEEAELVAAGALLDPQVRAPCAIFDLGGGSLEFIAKAGARERAFAASWPLGAVRTARRFFAAPEKAIPPEELRALRAFVRETAAATVAERVPAASAGGEGGVGGGADARLVFSGGAAGICAKLFDEKIFLSGGEIPAEFFESLLGEVGGSPLRERVALGVPAARADVFPAALATFAELCRITGARSVFHTRKNLRFGLCSVLARGRGGNGVFRCFP